MSMSDKLSLISLIIILLFSFVSLKEVQQEFVNVNEDYKFVLKATELYVTAKADKMGAFVYQIKYPKSLGSLKEHISYITTASPGLPNEEAFSKLGNSTETTSDDITTLMTVFGIDQNHYSHVRYNNLQKDLEVQLKVYYLSSTYILLIVIIVIAVLILVLCLVFCCIKKICC